MRRHAGPLCSIAIGWTLLTACLAVAQEDRAPLAPERARPKADVAREAMRREAEARERERLDGFARLRALPAAPREGRLEVLPGGIVVRRFLEVEQEEEDEPDEKAPPRPRVVISEESFDQCLFGTTGDTKSGHVYLESLLRRRIDDLDRMRGLTPAQKKKLFLAGRGDIKRLFDLIEEERKEFEQVRTDADRCERFFRELQPLRLTIRQGPFEFGSIFDKALRKMIGEQQAAGRRPS
jgi:hypothetical protein